MGQPEKTTKIKRPRGTPYKTRCMFSDTALDPNHEHYWGCKKMFKKTMIIRCQVCGLEEKRKVDWDKIPVGEVPDLNE